MKLLPKRKERAAADDGRMTLVEHLAELRSRLIKSVIALVVGGVVAWILYDHVFSFLIHPYCGLQKSSEAECKLLQISPLEGFSVRLKVVGYCAIGFAMPVILWQLWRFITPGLYPHEKKYAVPFVASALVLFALGAGIAYWTMPKALGFLGSIGGSNLQQNYAPGPYFQLISYMMLAFGLGFEFPILLIFLQMAGIVSAAQLSSWRRYAIVVIFIVVAVATPSGDPYSLFALSVPMCLFYEISILIGRALRK